VNAEFNLSSLPAGNYVLAVSSGKKILDTRKLSKGDPQLTGQTASR
jgi:hypothetical protein